MPRPPFRPKEVSQPIMNLPPNLQRSASIESLGRLRTRLFERVIQSQDCLLRDILLRLPPHQTRKVPHHPLGQQTHPHGNRPNQLVTRRQIPLPQPFQVRVHPRGRQHRQASGWKKDSSPQQQICQSSYQTRPQTTNRHPQNHFFSSDFRKHLPEITTRNNHTSFEHRISTQPYNRHDVTTNIISATALETCEANPKNTAPFKHDLDLSPSLLIALGQTVANVSGHATTNSPTPA